MKRSCGYLLICAILLVGCATTTSKKAIMINVNMTKEEVVNILGYPGDRQFRGDDEAWQYFDLGFDTDRYTVVWFYQNKVTGITSYIGTGANLTARYKTIDWEERPDYSVEVRQR